MVGRRGVDIDDGRVPEEGSVEGKWVVGGVRVQLLSLAGNEDPGVR